MLVGLKEVLRFKRLVWEEPVSPADAKVEELYFRV